MDRVRSPNGFRPSLKQADEADIANLGKLRQFTCFAMHQCLTFLLGEYTLNIMTHTRLPSSQRKEEIARASAALFGERGLHATTTRAIAQAAGVSEALLLKYFSSKEAVFEAALAACRADAFSDGEAHLLHAEPSTVTLVAILRRLVEYILLPPAAALLSRAATNRLMLRSLCEDGAFARMMLSDVGRNGPVAKIAACLEVAQAAGDLHPLPGQQIGSAAWLAHHIMFSLMMLELPTPAAIDYATPAEDLAQATLLFILRGVGLTEAAIERHVGTTT